MKRDGSASSDKVAGDKRQEVIASPAVYELIIGHRRQYWLADVNAGAFRELLYEEDGKRERGVPVVAARLCYEFFR